MDKEQELRPCKACGQPEGHIAANGGWLWGECWNCDYRTSFHRSDAEAQEEWNRRSSSDEQADVVEFHVTDEKNGIDYTAHAKSPSPAVAAGGVTVPSVDEIEAIILATEPDIPASVDGERIWTRRMAKGLHSALTAALAVRDGRARQALGDTL